VLYARWTQARGKYAASTKEWEDLRPVYASQELYLRAVDKGGLAATDVVTPVVTQAAKLAGVPVTDTGFSYPLELDRSELKRRIDELNNSASGDIPCFERTLDVIETDVEMMKMRANAWALGDVSALRGLSTREIQPPCREVSDASLAFLGAAELKQKLRTTWLRAAQSSLSRNQSTFASLPISDLKDETGILADLRKLGYLVEAPDAEPVDEP